MCKITRELMLDYDREESGHAIEALIIDFEDGGTVSYMIWLINMVHEKKAELTKYAAY